MPAARFRAGIRVSRLFTAAALAAAVGLLAACGSSSPSTSSTGSATAGGGSSSPAAYPTQDVVSSIAEDPALKAELPSAVQSSGTLTLGTTFQPGTAGLPYAGQINGQNVGVDTDLNNAVARVLGVTWNVQNGTFATIIPGVQNGRYNVGEDNFGVTTAREQVIDFATYLTDGQSFLVPSSSSLSNVTDLTQLCGLTIGTGSGSTFQQILTQGASKCAAAGKKPYAVQYFADVAPIILGLTNGKLDAYFGPTLGLQYEAAHIQGLKFAGQFSSTPVGFVTPKGSPIAKALTDAVNKLIADGDYAKILAKWGVTSSGIPQSQVNPPATL